MENKNIKKVYISNTELIKFFYKFNIYELELFNPLFDKIGKEIDIENVLIAARKVYLEKYKETEEEYGFIERNTQFKLGMLSNKLKILNQKELIFFEKMIVLTENGLSKEEKECYDIDILKENINNEKNNRNIKEMTDKELMNFFNKFNYMELNYIKFILFFVFDFELENGMSFDKQKINEIANKIFEEKYKNLDNELNSNKKVIDTIITKLKKLNDKEYLFLKGIVNSSLMAIECTNLEGYEREIRELSKISDGLENNTKEYIIQYKNN